MNMYIFDFERKSIFKENVRKLWFCAIISLSIWWS